MSLLFICLSFTCSPSPDFLPDFFSFMSSLLFDRSMYKNEEKLHYLDCPFFCIILQSANVRKPLFLARNISKFNRGSARVPPAKLLIKSEENSDMSNWKNSNDSKKETPATTEPTTTNNDKSASPTTPTVTVPTTTTPEADSSSVLTTSSSGVPPPLVLPKLPDPFWNKRPPERIGQAESYGDCFVDDQQQVKFNYNSYKSVFLTKGYILYRSNSLKRAKEVSFYSSTSIKLEINENLTKFF